jgi:chloramphenicol-sensitive protein RarD
MQFLIGVLLLHESMPPARLVGFVLVWIALIVLTIDRFWASRRPNVAAAPV